MDGWMMFVEGALNGISGCRSLLLTSVNVSGTLFAKGVI